MYDNDDEFEFLAFLLAFIMFILILIGLAEAEAD